MQEADAPTISVIMATFNSMKTIEKSLKSIRGQNYPEDKVQIILIDGGSTDGTLDLAKKYGCEVHHNPQTEPVYAKMMGFALARGDLLTHTDSDEVIVSKNTFRHIANFFRDNPDVYWLNSSGYKNPQGYPFINNYINDFGDPFTAFYYKVAKGYGSFLRDIRKHFKRVRQTDEHEVFELNKAGVQPLFENAAMLSTINLQFCREQLPDLQGVYGEHLHVFYWLQEHSNKFGMLVDDPIEHYSADTIRGYLKKIQWRVKNNIFFLESLGKSGFTGRTRFDKPHIRLRKYLFIPYSLLVLPVVLDALRIGIANKDLRYLIHAPLCIYTSYLILMYYTLKIFGYKPRLKSYGSNQSVSRQV